MSAHEYERSEDHRQIRVRGGDIAELLAVVGAFAGEDNEEARWFTEGDTLVLEHPLVTSLIGGEAYPAPLPDPSPDVRPKNGEKP
tara:strand:- start:1801 stop:2055 length:255 start_codon:yes stop_codon:yes gene_type:complete